MATADTPAAHKMIAKGICHMSWLFPTAAGDTTGIGYAMNAPNLPDKTVYVMGPTSGTTRLVIEGTNASTPDEGVTTWITLTDAQGNPLDHVSQYIETILENPRYIRPRAPVVTAARAIRVTIIARGPLR